VTKKQLKSLIDHCDAYGIDFQIDAESCYYPGHAIRILFKKGHLSPYDALYCFRERMICCKEELEATRDSLSGAAEPSDAPRTV
jgi:hypothetical protein